MVVQREDLITQLRDCKEKLASAVRSNEETDRSLRGQLSAAQSQLRHRLGELGAESDRMQAQVIIILGLQMCITFKYFGLSFF